MVWISVYTKARLFWLSMLLPNGFEASAFPCNQFLYQESGTNVEAQEYKCGGARIRMNKIQGRIHNFPKDTAPVYKFLKASKGAGTSGFLGSRIKWNFTKFLVDRAGKALCPYGTTTVPLSIEADIKKALGEA